MEADLAPASPYNRHRQNGFTQTFPVRQGFTKGEVCRKCTESGGDEEDNVEDISPYPDTQWLAYF